MEEAVQVLVVCGPRILLRRHASGPFEGRFTGALGARGGAERAEDAGARHAREQLGVDVSPARLQLRAVFDFIEFGPGSGARPGFTREYEFCAQVDERALAAVREGTRWFGLDEIPFESMPRDDAVWYPRVLGAGAGPARLLKGVFGFAGAEIVLQHVYEEPRAAAGPPRRVVWNRYDGTRATDYRHLVTDRRRLLVFGDNAERRGRGGTAAVRGAPNALGVATGAGGRGFQELDAGVAAIVDADFAAVVRAARDYDEVVFPSAGGDEWGFAIFTPADEVADYIRAAARRAADAIERRA